MSEEQLPLVWDKPQRQSILGVAVYMIRHFRALLTIFIALFAVGSKLTWFWYLIGFALLPVLIIFGVVSYYEYQNFTFQVKDNSLVIHKGVFFKERLVIDIDRIQSIQITDNLVQRVLGVVALKVDTAGSKGNELEIPALKRTYANDLKDLLYSKKKQLAKGEFQSEELPSGERFELEEEDESEQVLVHLSIRDLFVVGLTENHLRTALIAFAFIFGTLSQYQKTVESYLDESMDAYAEQAIRSGVKVVLLLIVLFAVVSVLVSIFRTVMRFYDLKAVLRSDAVEISTGLLKRNSFRVPIRKIQYVKWVSNPLRRWVGLESAKLKPSSSVGEDGKKHRIEIPALRIAQSEMLANGIFPAYHNPAFSIIPDAASYGRFFAIISGFILLPFLIFGYEGFGFWVLLLLITLPLIGMLGYRHGRSVVLSFDSAYVLIRKGWFFTNRVILPTYKVQSIAIHQNIFIARRNLCHLRLYTAAGELDLRYLPVDDARRLYDFLLYNVESSGEGWM